MTHICQILQTIEKCVELYNFVMDTKETNTVRDKVRSILRDHATTKLCGKGRFCAFRKYNPRSGKYGSKIYSGLTKQLQRHIYPQKTPPIGRSHSKFNGRTRGRRVDAQLSKVVNRKRFLVRSGEKLYTMTKIALATLHSQGIEPIAAQVPVCCDANGVATAVDVLAVRQCHDDRDMLELVIIELKTGYDQDRMKSNQELHLKAPLNTVNDNWCARHLTQLACTWRMFIQNKEMLTALKNRCHVRDVTAVLLYVTEHDQEMIELPYFYGERSRQVLQKMQ